MPRTVAAVHREHVEAFIEDQLARLQASQRGEPLPQPPAVLQWLADEGEIRESPMARMKPPTIPETPPEVLRDDQLKKLVAACSGTEFDDRRDLAIIMLLVDTGIRRGEIAGLTTEDVDWEHETLIVLGKGRRPRTVAFGRKVAKALDR